MNFLKAWRKRTGLVVGVILILMVLMHLNSRMLQKVQLQGERDATLARVEELRAEEAALDQQIAYARSDDIVDQWAREQNWMQREGDFVIALLGSEDSPPQQASELHESTPEMNNWDAWRWWLSFRE